MVRYAAPAHSRVKRPGAAAVSGRSRPGGRGPRCPWSCQACRAAADWAIKHPDKPVIVASYADAYGSPQANIDITRLRAQATFDALVVDGVQASRIQRQDIGSVKFQIDPQESRRVDVVVGNR